MRTCGKVFKNKTSEGFFFFQERARKNLLLEKLGYPECWVIRVKVKDWTEFLELRRWGLGPQELAQLCSAPPEVDSYKASSNLEL